MKNSFFLLISAAFLLLSCSNEEGLKTYTVVFEADGTGSIEYLIHSANCGDDLTFCARDAIFENQSLPFKAVVENYYSELFYIRIFLTDEPEKDNLSELRITIDDKVQILNQEDFWWDDSPNEYFLEFSVSP